MTLFPTDIQAIEDRIRHIDPVKYPFTRNFRDGAVTRLSPYVSRGVISTRQIYDHIRSLDLKWPQVEKLVQELAWRDYWQQVNFRSAGNALTLYWDFRKTPRVYRCLQENFRKFPWTPAILSTKNIR